MKRNLVSQLFSYSVFATVKTCVQIGQLKSVIIIINTSEFLKTLNNLFDCLNSKNLYNKTLYQCVLIRENYLLTNF